MNLLRVLARDMDMSPEAARCMVSHGQVSVDGVVVALDRVDRSVDDVRGCILRAGRREHRLFASGPVIGNIPFVAHSPQIAYGAHSAPDQLELG